MALARTTNTWAYRGVNVQRRTPLWPFWHEAILALYTCKAMKDGERFSVVVSLAHSCLPNETASINRRVASIEHEWQTEEDVSVASKLISQNGPVITG